MLSSRSSSVEALEETADRMSACLIHRGPDDHGRWVEPTAGLAFGFRRLSIIDLTACGHQPMRSHSGRFTLVFNGEVFNHEELREQLSDGARFAGHSDTEVILAAFERWGVHEAVTRFIGMFAIAVWDASTRRLHLIRDRLGIKPLFYSHLNGTLLFGSELKALMAVPEFDRTIDHDAVSSYLRYLYVPAPQTIFRHASKLLPGHILTIASPDDALREPEPYWSLKAVSRAGRANPFAGTDAEAVDALEALLTDAVRLRMRSDVPMGALLSGGIDSSTVVALMQRQSATPIRTFAIGFPSSEHDEAAHAREVARRLGTDHTELSVSGDDALAVVPRLSTMFDEPLADPSQIPTFLVSELARRSVTVALTGDGGDELFAGYERYLRGVGVIRRIARVPPVLRAVAGRGVAAAGSDFWDRTYRAIAPIVSRGRRERLAGSKFRKLGNMLRQRSPSAMYHSLLSAWQEPQRLLTTPSHSRTIVQQALDQHERLPMLERMMLVDQHSYLADDLLAKVDRASMAVSLEARVPLLDHRVVEFSWRLPEHFKVRDGEGKWILRQVLYRHLDRQLFERPKTGFSAPIGDWLRGPLREWAGDLLFPSSGAGSGLFRPEPVRDAWQRHQRGGDELAVGLWAVVMLEAWRQRWLT